jgi:O-antigen ligase
MSVWTSQAGRPSIWRRRLGVTSLGERRLALLLGLVMMVRVLTDNLASPASRQSGSFDLSGAIAVLLVIAAFGVLSRRRCGILPAAVAALWLCVWTVLAVSTDGASTTALREGVREGSVVALAVLVYNMRGALTVPAATRIVQLMGLLPAVLAAYQLLTNTGMDIAGMTRANGTFAHPDSAAMFFSLAAIASLWLYLDNGRRRLDVLLVALFATAALATLSIDGVAALVTMSVALGALRPGSLGIDRLPYIVAGLVVLAFLATPAGAQRIAKESRTNLATAERGEANTSLDWRLHKWETLLPQWETSPLLGRGLGTTTTTVPVLGNRYSGKPPHNEYVRYLVETGVVGLSVLLGALTLLGRSLLRRRRMPVTSRGGTLNAPTLAIAVVIGCLVNALADNTFLNSPTCYAAVLIVVAVLSLPEIGVRQRRAVRAG